jgi:ABC-type nitrate/sulfonate/bicarbonate transport system substrate-binding protein
MGKIILQYPIHDNRRFLMKKARFFVLALLIIGGVAFAESPIVTIPWFAPLSLQIPLIAKEKGFDQEFGIDLKLINLTRASEAIQALLTGDVDVTFSPFLTAETAVLKGAKVKGFIMAYYGGDKFALVTMKKTGITKIEDLVGKTIAVPGLGAPPELFVRKVAAMKGISPDSYKLVQQALDMIPASLATGQVDAGMIFEPTLTAFMAKQDGVVILTRGVDIPAVNFVPNAYWVREDRLKKDTELIYKVYLTLAKAEWFIRTKGPDSDEVLSIVAKAANMPVAVFKPSADKNIWDPRIKPIQIDGIKEEAKFFFDMGKLEGMVSVPDLWDNSFYTRARLEHPELFADLDGYLQRLKKNGIAKDEDLRIEVK